MIGCEGVALKSDHKAITFDLLSRSDPKINILDKTLSTFKKLTSKACALPWAVIVCQTQSC